MLAQLPAPPSGKSGFPWTVQTNPDIYDKNITYPKISIVTPSYNQGAFIEETIRSILLQNYPNLEYIIIDGGSTDNTVEIIKKYEPWITYWVSEKDRGQSHAINKGLALCTGDIFNWICSDDSLLENALFYVAQMYLQAPQAKAYTGGTKAVLVNSTGEEQILKISYTNETSVKFQSFHQGIAGLSRVFAYQPSAFINMRLLEAVGKYVEEDLHYTMDYEMHARLILGGLDVCIVNQNITKVTNHEHNKSQTAFPKFAEDNIRTFNRIISQLPEEKTKTIKTHLQAMRLLRSAEKPIKPYYLAFELDEKQLYHAFENVLGGIVTYYNLAKEYKKAFTIIRYCTFHNIILREISNLEKIKIGIKYAINCLK